MKTPLFSIIIPVYGVEPYLCKCLDSVVNQTFDDWECICVDDGSPDNCGKILDEYKASFKGTQRLEVIHQQNGGVSVARNMALDVAKGEWVQFLDSDDSLKLDFLEKLAADIQKHPDVDAVEHSAIYCKEDGSQSVGTYSGRLAPECVITGEDVLKDAFGRKFTNLSRCVWNKIFRRLLFERYQLRFAKGVPLGEDTLFATQFYAFAGKVAICPKTSGYLRIFREGSALMTVSPEKLIPQLRAIEILYQTWQRRPTRGMVVRLSASVVMLAYLGSNYGKETRLKCLEALLKSEFFNRQGMRFELLHGTWKARLFALVYLLSPWCLRRRLLMRLG